MRRLSTVLLGFMLAATLAAPVMAANVGATPEGSAGLDSPVPMPIETKPKVAVTFYSDHIIATCHCRNYRVPTFESPLESALAG